MGFEGFNSSKWPSLVRHQRSMSFLDSKRSDEGNMAQSAEAATKAKLMHIIDVDVEFQSTGSVGNLGDSKRSQEGKLSQSTIFLHDWWLVKADPDSHGKQLGIGGSTWKGNQGIRCFSSASICKRHDAVTLQTVDGVTVMVQGYLNRSRTLENGFSEEVCDHFLIGFPYYWEEYAVLSVSEEPGPPYNSSDSKGASHPSDACKTPANEECAAVSAGEKAGNFSASKGASPSDAYKTPAQETRANLAGGPLTRSRARLLATTARLGR